MTAGGYAILSILTGGLLGMAFYALKVLRSKMDRLETSLSAKVDGVAVTVREQGERLARIEGRLELSRG